MSNPNEWVWLTHDELGDSPNPVLRSSLHHWARQGWTETDPPKPPEPDPAVQGAEATNVPGFGVTTQLAASGVAEEKPRGAARPVIPARSESAATPAATENKE